VKRVATVDGLLRAWMKFGLVAGIVVLVWLAFTLVAIVDDLIDPPIHLVEVGMSRAEVEQLFGPDDPTNRDGLEPDDALVYEMGCWIDCTWAVVHFDEHDRVEWIDEYMD
jgi:hypothetical protein